MELSYQLDMLLNRLELEEREARGLAGYAIKSADSGGRNFPEKEDQYRLCFQKDKERVIHSKAFRRLDQKTQVFMAGTGDHYRTRLTHTLEVAQISRGMARRLGLNEDLAEVIALSHDLGHPPFGHAGEEALDEVMRGFGDHFEHNEQSRRIVEKLEKAYPTFDGLNLTLEVLDGLIKHQTAFDQAGKEFDVSAHLEAQVVNIGDEIAYTNHDIDDALRAGLISLEQLDDFEIWQSAKSEVFAKYGQKLARDVLVSRTVSSMISLMIDDLCRQSEENLQKHAIKTVEDVQKFKGNIAHFSEKMQKMLVALRQFLFDNFYLSSEVLEAAEEGKAMIKRLFSHYMEGGGRELRGDGEDFVRVKDYIAGMTDSFLAREYLACSD